ncbi:MAG TPA: formylglycine-generating enzyme family protein [Steroidobacteraceae bacterium]|nr:formylglycine-generating enzyme family protein [Steroidobacteraceae bacterium]
MRRLRHCVASLVGAAFVLVGAHAQGATLFKDCADCPELVAVPPGVFAMGSLDGEPGRDEGPIRRIQIERPFALGRTEVTRAQYAAFVDATGHVIDPGCRTYRDGEWRDVVDADWRDNGLDPPDVALPVTCVSWDDAQAYLEWLSEKSGLRYRLPSEAEWEYAARAGSESAWPWGNNPDNGCAHANLYDRSARQQRDFGWAHADCDDGEPGLAIAGRYRPNAFGLHDMIGNVWEWTADCYREGYASAPVDGSPFDLAECDRRSVRGGSWMTRPSRARASFRGRDPAPRRMAYFGFRVARDLEVQEMASAAGETRTPGLRRVSIVLGSDPDMDRALGLLRDVLGLEVLRDGVLASASARATLDLPPDAGLRFATVAGDGPEPTTLGLLASDRPQDAGAARAVAVYAVDGLDSYVAAVRAAGYEISVPRPFGTAPGVHGREATISAIPGLVVILQELGP